MEMVNFNNTILADIPIVSHTLLVEIFMDEFSRGQKLGKFKIYFPECCISKNFVGVIFVNDIQIMTLSSIFLGVCAKISKIKIFIRLIFANKQDWICFGIYCCEFGQNSQNSRKSVP